MGNCQKEESLFNDGLIRNGPIQQIRVTNYIWTKDYQGLFDYQSNSIQKKSFKVDKNIILSKQGSQQIFHQDNLSKLKLNQSLLKELKNCLFRMTKKQHFYQIQTIFIEDQNYTLHKLLWLVVNSVPKKNYTLQQKDIIKLGKQKIRVREIVPFDQNPSLVVDFNNIQVSKAIYDDLNQKHGQQITTTNFLKGQQNVEKDNLSVATTNQHVCRICLDPGENTNPLIVPCKCSGSVKYIHLTCLRAWLAKRIKAHKTNFCITINWQPLSCQMCKSPFKYRVYLDNKKFYTVQIPKPPKPYIVLEIVKKNANNKGKVFQFISLAQKNKVSLGRRKDIDVRISQDISVSRNHASISYNQQTKQFILADNKSKFGTLILIKKSLLVRPEHTGISFQIGAQVFSFESVRSPGGQQIPQKMRQTNFFDDNIEDQDELQQEDNESEQGQQNQQLQNQLIQMSSPQLRRPISLNQNNLEP